MVRRFILKYNVFILGLYNQEYSAKWSTFFNKLYKVMSVVSKWLSVDVLCVLYICNRLYKIMSVTFKWLSVDILRVLFVNVCGPLVCGIILPEDGSEGPKHVGAFIYLINITKCIRWISLFSICDVYI
jgi:hypothetical protein